MSGRNAKSSRSRSLNKKESAAAKKQRNTSLVNESMDESKAKTKSGAEAGEKADNNQANKNGSGAASKKPAEMEKKAPAGQKESTQRVTRPKTSEQPFVLRRSARNINRAKAAAAKLELESEAKVAQPQPFFSKSAGKAKAAAQTEQNTQTQGASRFRRTAPYPRVPKVDHSMPASQTEPTRFIQTRQRTAAAMKAKSLGADSGTSSRATRRALNKTAHDKTEAIEEKIRTDAKGGRDSSKTLSKQSTDTKAALSEASKSTKADQKKAGASDGGKKESASNHKEHEKNVVKVDKEEISSQAVVADAPSSTTKHAPISATEVTHDVRKRDVSSASDAHLGASHDVPMLRSILKKPAVETQNPGARSARRNLSWCNPEIIQDPRDNANTQQEENSQMKNIYNDDESDLMKELSKAYKNKLRSSNNMDKQQALNLQEKITPKQEFQLPGKEKSCKTIDSGEEPINSQEEQRANIISSEVHQNVMNTTTIDEQKKFRSSRRNSNVLLVDVACQVEEINLDYDNMLSNEEFILNLEGLVNVKELKGESYGFDIIEESKSKIQQFGNDEEDEENSNKSTDGLAAKFNDISKGEMQIKEKDKTIELEKKIDSKSHCSPGHLPSESFTIDEANLASVDINTLQEIKAQLKKQLEMIDSGATESKSEQEVEPVTAVDESVSKVDEYVGTSNGYRIGPNYFQYREGSSNDASEVEDYCPNSETDTNVLTNQQDIDGNKEVNVESLMTSEPSLDVFETAKDKARIENIMKLKEFQIFIKESDDVSKELSDGGTRIYCDREQKHWDAYAKCKTFDKKWKSSKNSYSEKFMPHTDQRMKKGAEIEWTYVEPVKVETEIHDHKRNIAVEHEQVNERERVEGGQANTHSFNEPLDGCKDTTLDTLPFPLPDFTELMQMETQSETFDISSCLNELSLMETDCKNEAQMLEGQQWLETDEARELLESINEATSIMPMDQTVDDATQAAQEPTAAIKQKDDSSIQMEMKWKCSAEGQEFLQFLNDLQNLPAVTFQGNECTQVLPVNTDNIANEDRQQECIATKEKPQVRQHLEDEDDVDLEEIGVPATYDVYWPSSLSEEQAIKLEHPNEILEMSILMAMDLPKRTYNATPALTERLNDPRRFSDMQLEAVTYVGQAHEQILPNGERAGFLLGDGPGVGKTRTLAAIIYDNFMHDRIRALWVAAYESLSSDVDREFEFIDQTAHIKVVPIGDFNYDQITLDGEGDEAYLGGVVCASYTDLAGESKQRSAKFRSHVCQLAEWLGSNGVIILDDCHKATSQSLINRYSFMSICQAVHQLQQLLPLARIVYASDSGASDPRNMVYMTRLGLWGNGTPYAEYLDFVTAMEKRGTDSMQIVAVDLKMRGNYMSRQLSFEKVAYHIEVVFMSQEFCSVYNDSTMLWSEILKEMYTCFRRLRMDARVRDRITQHYWVSHYRFFKNLWLAEKLIRVVDLAKEALESDYSIILGIHSTNESQGEWQYMPQDIMNPTGLVSTAKAIILLFMQRYFPAPSSAYIERLTEKGAFDPLKRADPNGFALECLKVDLAISNSDGSDDRSDDDEQNKIKLAEQMIRERGLEIIYNNRREELAPEEFELNFEDVDLLNNKISESTLRDCMAAREQILVSVEELSHRLPLNTLDELIEELGGSEEVAEITHRRGRILQIDEDVYEYEQRGDTPAALDMTNYAESLSFVDNEKLVAIVSETAAGGLSLHSDRYVTNRRPRIFMSLELPWSVDHALRQFGCAARSNQVNEPEIIMVISHVETELHLAKAVAMELRSRGAFDSVPPLGEPFGRSQALSTINNSLGASVIRSMLEQIAGIEQLEEKHVPNSYLDQFTAGCRAAMIGAGLLHAQINDVGERVYILDTASQHVLTFLNRLLSCQIDMQNAMFKFFLNKMYAMMVELKRSHQFNLGIIDLDVHFSIVSVSKLITFRRESATGTTISELRTIDVERGISFDEALAKYTKRNRSEHEGFYILQRKRSQRTCVILCLTPTLEEDSPETDTQLDANLVVIRPNTGARVHTELLSSLTKRYSKTSIMNARQFWTAQYTECLTSCAHKYFSCECPYGKSCRLGERVRTYNVLSGQLLNMGEQLAKIIERNERQMQMVRVHIEKERCIMGVLIPDFAYQSVLAELSSNATVESNDLV